MLTALHTVDDLINESLNRSNQILVSEQDSFARKQKLAHETQTRESLRLTRGYLVDLLERVVPFAIVELGDVETYQHKHRLTLTVEY